MIRTLRHKTEKFLYRKNFLSPIIRRLLSTQILIALTALVGGFIVLPFTDWLIFFASGALITTFNFWHIARFACEHTGRPFSVFMGIKYFLMFNIRLIATGVLLFVLIFWLHAPLIPLIAGLASVTVVLLIWGISRASTTQA